MNINKNNSKIDLLSQLEKKIRIMEGENPTQVEKDYQANLLNNKETLGFPQRKRYGLAGISMATFMKICGAALLLYLVYEQLMGL